MVFGEWLLKTHDGKPNQVCESSKKDGGLVTFGDNTKGKIIGKGTIGNDYGTLIENVLLVDDFLRFTWVLMIKHKNDVLKKIC